MPYDPLDLETDPSALAEEAFIYLQDRWPGWLPQPSNFDAGTIEAHARMVAEARDVAVQVPDGIFRKLGDLSGVPAIAATAAQAHATLTAIDDLGYTLEAGTVVGIQATGDQLVTFAVVDDVVIAPGLTASTAGEVLLVAEEDGADGTALGGVGVSAEVVDRTLPWLVSLILTEATTGGADGEEDSEHEDRLSEELQLSAPTPITADNFALFARRHLAVDRAVAVNLHVPGVNEQQTISHNYTAGTTGTLTYSGQTTGSLVWNSSAAAIQAALEALSNIGVGDVLVTGGPWPAAVTVQFMGALAETNVAAITASVGNFTGGTAFTITTTVAGVAALSNVEKAVTTWVVDADGLDPGQSVRDEIAADFAARREVNFLPYVRAPAYMAVAVAYSFATYATHDPDDVEARADEALEEYLSPADWGVVGGADDPSRSWVFDDRVRRSELIEVLNGVDGLHYVDIATLTINAVAADLTLVGGKVVLPTPGAMVGTQL